MNKSYDRNDLIEMLKAEIARLDARILIAIDDRDECGANGSDHDYDEYNYLDKRVIKLAERRRKAKESLAALRAATIEYGNRR